MVSLREAMKALLKDVVDPFKLEHGFAVRHLRTFWCKELRELTSEEIAYAFTAMLHIGKNMTAEEKTRSGRNFFGKNRIVQLLEEEEAT